ncbi:MAG: hypothetical protein WC393_02705 [Candidatus Nanoarchaeia archaeon]|jgi:succinate dehydrogenase hydrophobic anchor subunit
MINKFERRKVNKKVRAKAVKKEKSKENKRNIKRNIVTGAILIILVFTFLYFFVVSPTFVIKPYIFKTELASASDINSDHASWLLNEMNAYKLHSYLGNPSVIETVITDQNRTFTTTIINNYPTTAGGVATNPDIRFSITSADFVTLYSATDTMAKAQEMRQSSQIQVTILKNDFILAVKGYKAIYDAFPGLPWQ